MSSGKNKDRRITDEVRDVMRLRRYPIRTEPNIPSETSGSGAGMPSVVRRGNAVRNGRRLRVLFLPAGNAEAVR